MKAGAGTETKCPEENPIDAETAFFDWDKPVR